MGVIRNPAESMPPPGPQGGAAFGPQGGALPGSPGGAVNPVDWVVGWARANSLWPLVFGTSCCAIEMMATGASDNDWARFGMEVARATPRQADLIILAGTIVEKMGSRLVTLYDQMPGPKYVIAMGACTISGGPFYFDSYSVVKGADRLIPVDVYVPGCPPRPEALLYGVLKLQELIRQGGRNAAFHPRPINKAPMVDVITDCANKWEEQEKKKQEEMKEAQERFKAENPDYKGVVIKRIAAPKFDEVARVPRPERGMAAAAIWDLVSARFPEAAVHDLAKLVPAPKPTPAPAAPAESAPGSTAEAAAPVAPAVELTVSGKIASIGAEYVLDVSVKREDYLPLVRYLKEEPSLRLDYLIELTAIDWKDRFDVVVHLLSMEKGHKVFIRCSLPHDEHPEIASLTAVHAGANWHEREAFDFFGIHFAGHPDLRRIFLEEDFPGHPLRKDFEDPSRVVKRPY